MLGVNFYYPTVFAVSMLVLFPALWVGMRAVDSLVDRLRTIRMSGGFDPRMMRFREDDWE